MAGFANVDPLASFLSSAILDSAPAFGDPPRGTRSIKQFSSKPGVVIIGLRGGGQGAQQEVRELRGSAGDQVPGHRAPR
eukprot:5082740-Alexandrium_andersonii.AAC.1